MAVCGCGIIWSTIPDIFLEGLGTIRKTSGSKDDIETQIWDQGLQKIAACSTKTFYRANLIFSGIGPIKSFRRPSSSKKQPRAEKIWKERWYVALRSATYTWNTVRHKRKPADRLLKQLRSCARLYASNDSMTIKRFFNEILHKTAPLKFVTALQLWITDTVREHLTGETQT